MAWNNGKIRKILREHAIPHESIGEEILMYADMHSDKITDIICIEENKS